MSVTTKRVPASRTGSRSGRQSGQAASSVVVDPRLVARRDEVARDHARRRLQQWGVIGLVLLVGIAAAASTRTALLDVDRVAVAGAERSGAAVVAKASGLEIGGRMVDADLGAAEDRVLALPWVGESKIRRDWPGTLVVEVTERTPVVVVSAVEGGAFLVDGDGRLLEHLEELPIRTPDLVGPGGSGADVAGTDSGGLVLLDGAVEGATAGMTLRDEDKSLVHVASMLSVTVRSLRPVVGRGEDGALVIRLAPDAGLPSDSGITDPEIQSYATIMLGRPADVAVSLSSADAVLEQVDIECLAVLDVRVPNSPVVTRTPSCES